MHGAGTGIDQANGIALGSMGEFYLTGIYGPSLTLGQKQATGDSPLINAYLAQLDEDLNTRWIKTVGGGGLNRGESVAVDAKGRAFFVGSFSGTAHFDERSLTARGGSDAYLAEFDYRGNVLRLHSHGGTGADAGTAVALDNEGGIIITGTYTGEAHIFDGEHICHEHGGTDVFVARYDYLIEEPETHFTVTVEEDENGTEVILLNDEPAPEVELIPGLTYTFEVDENTTDENPIVIVEQVEVPQPSDDDENNTENNQSLVTELWEFEDDVNKTDTKVVIKVDEDTPPTLGYKGKDDPEIGGGIVVKQNPTPKYRLTIAQFDEGNNSVEGADIRVFKNSQEVSLNDPFEEGTRLRIELHEREEYIFEGWEGDLPRDANQSLNKAKTFVVKMDRDREIIAYFSTPIPDDPRDFLDQFRLGIRADEVDENGNKSAPYVIIFDVDQDGVKEDGTSGNVRIMEILNENGTIGENTVNRLDFDGDGNSDSILGRFIFEQTSEGEGSFRIVDMTATLASGGEWTGDDPWGGSMDLSVTFRKDEGGRMSGNFINFKSDGTVDQGGVDSEQVRKDFAL